MACLSYHNGMRREIPRDYCQTLEAEVASLRQEVNSLRSLVPGSVDHEGSDSEPQSSRVEDPSPATGQPTQDQEDVIMSFAMIALEPLGEMRFLGTSSGVTLAKMVLGSINYQSPKMSTNPQEQDSTAHISLPLPPLDSALDLVDVYFQYRTAHFPIVERADIVASVYNAYGAANIAPMTLSQQQRRDLFVSFIIFAISSCGINMNRAARPESEAYFHSAIEYLDLALLFQPPDMEALRYILLLAQLVSLMPSKGSLWLLTGLALRLCLSLGLHWETKETLKLGEIQLNERRRLFWGAYHLDRLLVVIMGRPLGIEEQSIDVGPLLVRDLEGDEYTKIIANHLIQLARLESEIKHVLYRQQKSFSLAFPRPNLPTWMEDFEFRLRAWYESIPPVERAHPASIYASRHWWDASYNYIVLLLHRPTPQIPKPSPKSLEACFVASEMFIKCTQALLRDNRVTMVWEWVYRLFVSGICLVYAISHSHSVRASRPLGQIVNIAQACATVLAVLAERFSGAAGCRDVLAALVSATVTELLETRYRSSSTGNSPRPMAQESEKPSANLSPENEDLLPNVSSLFPGDIFNMDMDRDTWTAWPDMAEHMALTTSRQQSEGHSTHWSAEETTNNELLDEFICPP